MDPAVLAKKDPSVGDLVRRLAADLGASAFDLVDHWEDLMAVGLARPGDHDVFIYVSVLIDAEGEALASRERYFYECESPAEPGEPQVVADRDRVPYTEVLKAASRHLLAR